MKTIAVSQRVSVTENGEERDSIDRRLTRWLKFNGVLPIQVPNILVKGYSKLQGQTGFDSNLPTDVGLLSRWLDTLQPEGIVLSGGDDLGVDSLRDVTEYSLLDWALEKEIPVLGICRGMQIIGTWAGATLLEVFDHVAVEHDLKWQDGKRAGPHRVNSFHRFSLTSCPEGFSVMAISVSGEIEAIRHNSLSWEGWMWHPERNNPFDDQDSHNFCCLFSKNN